MATARKTAARQLATDFPDLVSVGQAKQMLAILNGDEKAARWCCEVVTQATARRLFADAIDPLHLARSVARRKGWQPTLERGSTTARSLLAALAGIVRNT